MKLTPSKDAVFLWRIYLLVAGALAALLLFTAFFIFGTGAIPASLVTAAAFCWVLFYWIPKRYESYRVDILPQNRIHLKYGVLFLREHSASISNILLFKQRQNPLQKSLGVVTLTLDLPGGVLRIPEIAEKDGLAFQEYWKKLRGTL